MNFFYKRSPDNGLCVQCKKYNISPGWCQPCDPLRKLLDWTSGDKYIDSYIKRFQFSAIRYDEAIEWIPFDRLVNIQKLSDIKFLAIWVDGIRLLLKIMENMCNHVTYLALLHL